MQYIGILDRNKLGIYGKIIPKQKVILTEERLEHILIYHRKEYEQLKEYIKNIIEEPDYILKDNKHKDTIIFLKDIKEIEKKGRVVIKIAQENDNIHVENSIITMMRLNERTWRQTLKNRGNIIWKKLDKNE